MGVTGTEAGPGVGGGQTVLADDRNGRRLRLYASRYDDDDFSAY